MLLYEVNPIFFLKINTQFAPKMLMRFFNIKWKERCLYLQTQKIQSPK